MNALKEKLKRSGLDTRGRKRDLVLRLSQDIQESESNESQSNDYSGLVNNSKRLDGVCNCKCGININDGRPMLECIKCKAWSHIVCYGLPEDAAKKTAVSVMCPTAADFSGASVDVDANFVTLQSQLAKYVRSFNSQILLYCVMNSLELNILWIVPSPVISLPFRMS